MTQKDQIVDTAIQLLSNQPNGLRFSELHKEIEKLGINKNSIPGVLVKLDSISDKIYKPSKGLFKHILYKEDEVIVDVIPKTKSLKESDFYEPFANWIINEMEECTKAIALGGAKFGGK